MTQDEWVTQQLRLEPRFARPLKRIENAYRCWEEDKITFEIWLEIVREECERLKEVVVALANDPAFHREWEKQEPGDVGL